MTMKRRESVTVWECDGCGAEKFQHKDEDPPPGHYIKSATVIGAGGDFVKDVYACANHCVVDAIHNVIRQG